MFSSAWNFLKRHKRKIFFTGALIGGAVLVGKYASQKFQEYQEKEVAEYNSFAKRQHLFESNQRTCNMTALSMIPNLREIILELLDSESLTAQLKSKPTNKVDIWNQLKIMSFTRTITAVYASCLLIIVIRVHFNIIGGYMYLDAQHTINNETIKTPSSLEIQKKYLENFHYILEKGLPDLIKLVQSAVEGIVHSLSLKDKISINDLMIITNKIRKKIEFDESIMKPAANRFVGFIMPPNHVQHEASNDIEQTCAKLNMETMDVFETADFLCVLNNCLDTAFTRMLDKVSEYYKSNDKENERFVNIQDVEMPLAKLIPIMNGLINIMCADAPNSFIQELLLKEKLKEFAANIYEAFSQSESCR